MPDAAHPACGHLVRFYESDAALAAGVVEFLGDGLQDGTSAVVVATADHRAAFLAGLADRGIDVDAARAADHLVVLDAQETLGRFMDGHPDAARFNAAIGDVLDRATRDGRPVRVFGEMVAVLWEQGDVGSALALEDLWNLLARVRPFELLCAYPIGAFDDAHTAAAFARVCEQHTHVLPVEDPDLPLEPVDDQASLRRLAALQREVRSLRARLERSGFAGEPAPSSNRHREHDDLGHPAWADPSLADRPSRRATDDLVAGLVAPLVQALRHGDPTGASAVLDEGLLSGVAAVTLLDRVVAPAMHHIGLLWQDDALTVAEEHLATVTCQRAITGLYPALLLGRPRSRERVLVAGIQGEGHGLAPRMVADVLEGLGYDVVHLGLDMPIEGLAQSVVRYEPALVALSATLPGAADTLRRTVAAIQRERPDVPLLLGGQAVSAAWVAAGFPVASSIEEGTRMVAQLLRDRPAMPMVCGVGDRAPATRAVGRARTERPADRFLDATAQLGDLARTHALRAHELRFLALEDPLTRLPNRRAFDDRFRLAVEQGLDIALLVADVDGFKEINDQHGHETGDELLVRIGRAMADVVRPGDLVARLGGDEFAVLVTATSDVDARELAERVRRTVQERCSDLGATVSVGGTTSAGDPRLIALSADRALYAAKSAGRNAVAFEAATAAA